MRTTAKVNHGPHYAIPQCNRSLVTNEEEMADPTPPTAAPANFETLKWTDEDTRQFIAWRAANTMLFTGVKKSAKDGFEQFIKDKGLGGKISIQQVKRKWENLTAKYKALVRWRYRVEGDHGADGEKGAAGPGERERG
ncbi:unnamed protein product [Boreogadus saida]